MRSERDPAKTSPTCPACGADLGLSGDYMGEVTAYCVGKCGYEWDTVWDGRHDD